MIELRRWVYYRGELCLAQTFEDAISVTIEFLWFNEFRHRLRTGTGRLSPVCQIDIWRTRLFTQ